MKIDRLKVHLKYDGHCAYCGIHIAVKEMQVDHFIPQNRLICKPPTATFDQIHCEDNYMPACRACNMFKSTFDLDTFRSEIQKQVERLRRDKPTFRLAERYGLIECKPLEVTFHFEKLNNR